MANIDPITVPVRVEYDPGATLTKYLLALNDTLAELRHDMDKLCALDGTVSDRSQLCGWVKNNFAARLAVYAEIVRIVAEDTKPASEATHIVVDKGDEPKSNNTPVASPDVDEAMEKFRTVAAGDGGQHEQETETAGPHAGL